VRKPSFSLEQLRSFVAVAENEHISRAASSLYLTQAAVTQQVKHFEKSVGVRLLERDGRRVRLTEAGRSMAEACRAALRAVEVVSDSAQAMKDLHAGSLQVGASPTCATHYVPAHLAEFVRLHPGIRLSLSVEPSAELNRRVLAGTLETAVIEGAPDVALAAFELGRDELVLVARRDHPLSRLRRITPADFKKFRYLGRGPQRSAERYGRDMLGDAYYDVDPMNLEHSEYVRAAALAGLGYAALSTLTVASDLRAGLLKRLPVPPVVRSINAVRRHERGTPAQEAFWNLLTGGNVVSSGKMPLDGVAKH
jgi:DNA-binding transcriptional LysR family regulator